MNSAKFGMALVGLTSMGVSVAIAADSPPPAGYFRMQLTPGATYGDVFSRTFSIKGQGFQEIVKRQSGSAAYTVVDTNPDRPVFQLTYRYDGTAPGSGRVQIRDRGRTVCFDDKCQVDAETSGLAFDPVLWGEPPPNLMPGTSWRLRITQPWELGPPGNETIRVVSVDPANAAVMLDREGHGSGLSDSEDLHNVAMTVGKATVDAKIVAGASHWSGQTVFRHGIILSDVLLLERPVTLVTKIGSFKGIERAYTLLNAMPVKG